MGSAQAWGINGSGQVTGISDLPRPQGSTISPSHAFLYSGGTMIDIDAGDAGNSFGHGINDAGQVAGIIGWGSATQHAALFSAGTVTDLGTLGGQMSAAGGINNQGQIVGWSQISGQSAHHAFVWQNGAMVDITPSLPAGENSEASAANGKGQIVGIQQFPSGTHAALWQNGQVTDLGTLGGPSSEALGINSSGWIVGDSNGRASLYRDGDLTDLNTLLPPNSGWNLTIAFAINDHGQIAGSGFHNGAFRPFLLALNSCQVNDSNVKHVAGGLGGTLSRDSRPTSMIGTFTPPSGLTLAAYASACGFAGFDWEQKVTSLPCPSPFLASLAQLSVQNVCSDGIGITAPPSFNDPPSGGYTFPPQYQGYDPFPFYYPAPLVLSNEQVPGPACVPRAACVLPLVSPDDKTLAFYDAPADVCLPGGNIIEQYIWCGGMSAPAPSFLGFTTSLVGVFRGGGVSSPLFHWSWTDTFNGTSGGIPTTYSDSPVDPGSGTGGITITDINGAPQTPPGTTCTATLTTLWPPNGKSVSVTVSGTVTAGTQTIPASGTTFAVTDQYGQNQPTGGIAVGADGSYSFTVPLIASRKGSDLDGRTYTINVIAADAIGNVGSCSAVVVVPHDQGK